MMVLVVGPSGVGKSELGQCAEHQIVGCQFYDLDNLVKKSTGISTGELLPNIGNDAFLELCQEEVNALGCKCSDQLCVVAVGAGAPQSSDALEWLRCHSTVAVTASAEEVYKRGGPRNKDRSFEQFKQTEYSEDRNRIYESAEHKLDVDGLSLQQAKERFVELIESILNQPFGSV